MKLSAYPSTLCWKSKFCFKNDFSHALGDLLHLFDSEFDQHTVVPRQWHHIAHGPHRHQVQLPLEVHGLAEEASCVHGPSQGQKKEERHAASGKLPGRESRIFSLGVHQCPWLWAGVRHLVMVYDDGLHAELFGDFQLLYIGGAAIEADEETNASFVQGLNGPCVQSVAFIPSRQIHLRPHPDPFQEVHHQRGRGHTIRIVISEDPYFSSRCDGVEHCVNCGFYVREQKRIGEMLQTGVGGNAPPFRRY